MLGQRRWRAHAPHACPSSSRMHAHGPTAQSHLHMLWDSGTPLPRRGLRNSSFQLNMSPDRTCRLPYAPPLREQVQFAQDLHSDLEGSFALFAILLERHFFSHRVKTPVNAIAQNLKHSCPKQSEGTMFWRSLQLTAAPH